VGSEPAVNQKAKKTEAGVNQYATDLDFIDFVGFFWGWRWWLVLGLILGAAAGFTIKYVKSKAQPPSSEQSTTRWILQYIPVAPNPADYRVPPTTLIDFLKIADGATTFYEVIREKLNSKAFPVSEWAAKQQAGTGLVTSVEFDGFKIFVNLNAPEQLTEDEVRNGIAPSLTKTIQTLNDKYFNASENLRKESIEARLRVSEIALGALQAIQESQSMDPSLRFLLNEGTKDVGTILSEKKIVQELHIWLAAIPESDPRKKDLIRAYQYSQLIQESIEFRRKALQKAVGFENILKLDELDARNLEKIVRLPSPADPAKVRVGPLVSMIVGAIFGLATVMIAISVLSFFQKNKERLLRVFRSQEIDGI
jgi:hypothetical protein